MKLDWLPRDGANRWLEPALTLPVVVGGFYALWSVTTRHYFPAPFIYNTADSWMDWFNPAYYGHNSGAFDVWNALYPPFSFLFLKFTTLARCYVDNDSYTSRDCDWLGQLVLHAFFVINIFLVAKSLLMIDRGTALWRSIITAAGLPALHGLERGNLIMLTFTCFILAHGPLLKSARLRWLMLAITINTKIYLIPTLFAQLVKRRWRWFEGAALTTCGLWLVSWAFYGSGTPLELYDNLNTWASILDTPGKWLDIWYSATYLQLIGLFNSSAFPILDVLGSGYVETGALILTCIIQVTRAALVLAIGATWLRPEAVPLKRLVNLSAMLAMMMSEPGAYSLPLICFLTLTERWEGIGRKLAIIICYIIAIPGDIYISQISEQIQPGFLNRGLVFYYFWLTYGMFLRPGLTVIIPLCLSMVTIADVWRDIRCQAWADRRRFRLDLPLMLGGGAYRRPTRDFADE